MFLMFIKSNENEIISLKLCIGLFLKKFFVIYLFYVVYSTKESCFEKSFSCDILIKTNFYSVDNLSKFRCKNIEILLYLIYVNFLI